MKHLLLLLSITISAVAGPGAISEYYGSGAGIDPKGLLFIIVVVVIGFMHDKIFKRTKPTPTKPTSTTKHSNAVQNAFTVQKNYPKRRKFGDIIT